MGDVKDGGFEVGVVTCGPIRQTLGAIKTVWTTWFFAKRNSLPCAKWYGVYEAGTENIVAACGPLPGALERAEDICALLSQREAKP